MSLPSGTVTFLFTDIEGSTKLSQEYPDEMPSLLARHNQILSQAIHVYNGFVFQIVGDSYSAAFHNASDAMNATLDAQHALHNEGWSPVPIKVRMGIHTGPAQVQDESQDSRYSGYATLATSQRVMSAGHGGQILISPTTYDLLAKNLPDNVQLLDMGEHHLKDVIQKQHLYQLQAADLPSEFPPLKTQKVKKHNLPVKLTSFIGRERELVEAKSKLAEARLLTLIGPGGTGKTRLSVQLGGEQLALYSDGVWIVELAPISDEALIPQTIASVFGLRETPDRPLLELIIDYLRAKNMLIILDNCEHLIEACAKVAESLIQTCTSLKILASSREALGVSGEMTYRVPSLSLPKDLGSLKDLPSLIKFESVQLFVDRATTANSNFQLTEVNASSAAKVCRRLDGIPLALELAAARVRVLSVEQIAERLDDRFRLLTGGARTALPRQQTLRALIDWSYDLLSEPEKVLFRRLAVFVGGWTLDAAENVCSGDGVDTYEVLDLLAQLVDKSLAYTEETDGVVRYYRLETIRQYARDKLFESDDVVEVRNRHLEYFIELTEQVNQIWYGVESEFSTRIDTEDDNIRSALSWALESDPHKATQIMSWAVTMGRWIMRGFITEARDWCEQALSRLDALPPDQKRERSRAFILNRLSQGLMNLGDHHGSRSAAEQSVELAREVNDQKILAEALGSLGIGALYSGDPDYALKVTEESLAICEQIDFPQGRLWSLNTMMHIFNVTGNEPQKRKYSAEYVSTLQKMGVQPDPVDTEMNLSEQSLKDGDIESAISHANAVLSILEERGGTYRLVNFESNIAHEFRQAGFIEQASKHYRRTILLWQDFGHRAAVAHQLECFAFIAVEQEQYARATKLFGTAEALREVSNSVRTPVEQKEFDEAEANLRSWLNENEFNKIWEEGRLTTMEQAIVFALSDITN